MSEQWHKLRRENIGGSDVAALFGHGYISKYELWHIKKGNVEPAYLDNNERVQAGQFLEAGVIAWANHRWNLNFKQPRAYAKHPRISGMGCTPDAFDYAYGVEDNKPVGVDRIAQIKCVDGLQFAKELENDGEIITHAPLHIMLQCQHEMACTGATENWLIVLVGGNRLYRMVVERDDQVIKIIEDAVVAFWRTVEEGVEPAPDYVADGGTIRTLREKLNVIEEVDLSDDDDLLELLEGLHGATSQRKICAEAEERHKNKLIHLYGEYERIRCGDMTATIKADKNGHIRILIGNEKVSL